MKTFDLLDNPEIWQSDPLIAFTSFIKSPEFLKLSRRVVILLENTDDVKPLRNSAVTVYVAMFAKYIRWLQGRDVTKATAKDIVEFLNHREVFNGKELPRPVSLIRTRYLRLLERVYIHLHCTPNPAAQASKYLADQYSIGKDAAKVALTDEQQVAFMNQLPVADVIASPGDTSGWKKRRDRAMQALMLGAGLKVSEIVGLYVENIGVADVSGSVPVTISPATVNGTGRWHQTQLRPFAVKEVMDWVAERKAMKIPSKLLFPASLKHSKEINKATVYRHVQATFERAEINVHRKGGRTLRNSFAARELSKESASLELVGEFLGLRKLKSTAKYIPKE